MFKIIFNTIKKAFYQKYRTFKIIKHKVSGYYQISRKGYIFSYWTWMIKEYNMPFSFTREDDAREFLVKRYGNNVIIINE